MRKNFIFKALLFSLIIFTACQQNNELTDIESFSDLESLEEGNNTVDLNSLQEEQSDFDLLENKNSVGNFEQSSSIPDLTYVDGTPVDYSIVEDEILMIYEPGTTEARKIEIRYNFGLELGLSEVIPCNNPDVEIWKTRQLVIHDFNRESKVRIEADDDVQEARIGNGSGITCD
ncbi:hypothetical protein [Aquimarina rhabdastrellae]